MIGSVGRYIITELRDVHVTGGTSHVMVVLRWENSHVSGFYDTGQTAHVTVSRAVGESLRIGGEFAIGAEP